MYTQLLNFTLYAMYADDIDPWSSATWLFYFNFSMSNHQNDKRKENVKVTTWPRHLRQLSSQLNLHFPYSSFASLFISSFQVKKELFCFYLMYSFFLIFRRRRLLKNSLSLFKSPFILEALLASKTWRRKKADKNEVHLTLRSWSYQQTFVVTLQICIGYLI